MVWKTFRWELAAVINDMNNLLLINTRPAVRMGRTVSVIKDRELNEHPC
jgi:hypothetical protein